MSGAFPTCCKRIFFDHKHSMIFWSYWVQISNMEAVPEARNRSASRTGKHEVLDRHWLIKIWGHRVFCWVRRRRLNPAYGDNTGYGCGNKALAKLNPAYGDNLTKKSRLGWAERSQHVVRGVFFDHKQSMIFSPYWVQISNFPKKGFLKAIKSF